MSTGSEAKQERTVGTSRDTETVFTQNGQARRKKIADDTETRLNLSLTPKMRITAAQPPSREGYTLTAKLKKKSRRRRREIQKAP